VSDLELLRRLAPPVEPADPDVVDRAHARMTERRRRRPLWRRGGRRLPAAPVVAGAAIALVLFLTQTGGNDQPAWAAEVVRAAEASPRLLVDADGWRVTRVDEWAEGTGEMTFGNGQRQLEVRWMPGGDEAAQRNDKYGSDSQEHFEATVEGAHADVYRYDTQYSAIWLDADGNSVEALGQAPSKQAFLDVLTRLEKVDVDAWLTALPASAVTPKERGQAVTEIADGMPIPPGLDLEALRASGDATRDRYQLGAQVVGAVACGWIEHYWAGKDAGNPKQVAEAAAALRTVDTWPILAEMDAEGDYPVVLREYVHATLGDGKLPVESKVGKTKDVTLRESYASALGCDVPPAP
jgi:hypothetical protein